MAMLCQNRSNTNTCRTGFARYAYSAMMCSPSRCNVTVSKHLKAGVIAKAIYIPGIAKIQALGL